MTSSQSRAMEELQENLARLGHNWGAASSGIGSSKTAAENAAWWKKLDGKAVHDVEDIMDQFHLSAQQKRLELLCNRALQLNQHHVDVLTSLNPEARQAIESWHRDVNTYVRHRRHLADRFHRKEQLGELSWTRMAEYAEDDQLSDDDGDQDGSPVAGEESRGGMSPVSLPSIIPESPPPLEVRASFEQKPTAGGKSKGATSRLPRLPPVNLANTQASKDSGSPKSSPVFGKG